MASSFYQIQGNQMLKALDSFDFLRARLSNVSINDIRIVSCAQLAWQICAQKKPASGIPDAAIANALVEARTRN